VVFQLWLGKDANNLSKRKRKKTVRDPNTDGGITLKWIFKKMSSRT
jgi:hypothetical protein